MWRDFVTRISRKKKPPSVSSTVDSDVTGNYGGVTGGYNVTGHYSFHEQSPDSDESADEDDTWNSSLSDESTGNDELRWRDMYDILLGLIREPRLLLGETLSAETLKLSLKRQAYMVERILVIKSLKRWESTRHSLPHWDSGQEREAAALRQQLQHLDKTLSTLECRLDVLKAVQNALPPEFAATEDQDESEEPDSLEDSSLLMSSRITEDSKKKAPSNVGDMMALLRIERLAHRVTRRNLLTIRKQYERLRDELEWRDSGHGDEDPDQEEDNKSKEKAWTLRSNPSHRSGMSAIDRLNKDEPSSCTSLESFASQVPTDYLSNELHLKERTIAKLRLRVDELEKVRTEATAEDKTQEIANLQNSVAQLEKDKENLKAEIETIRSKYKHLVSSPAVSSPGEVNGLRNEPIGREAELSSPDNESQEIVNGSHGESHADRGIQRKRTYKISTDSLEVRQLRELLNELQSKEIEYKTRIKELEIELDERNSLIPETDHETLVNTLQQTLDERERALQDAERSLALKGDEVSATKLELEKLRDENYRLSNELERYVQKEKEQIKLIENLQQMEKDISKLEESNKMLSEDFNRERVQRKKYFNTIEELKGKIRVFCRVRPLMANEKQHSGKNVAAAVVDPYTVIVETPRGGREFQFDRVFVPEDSQETVFQDTNNLIQSAFDGYNVCICAYGQTGSGKTFTIVGDESHPGLAPRAFQRIFQLVQEYSVQFSVSVSVYMLELYNDKLIDLLRPSSVSEEGDRLEIKKDKKGIVWVQGATVITVVDAVALTTQFKRGLASRHTASTKMNDRSSRSHLVVGINVECTSRLHGTVIKGKVSLLDLAGSERIAKSGATSDQVREASSINKSLSTLGDVISALASNQSFIPYRNSKLTMLMQDSLGGNAKTLMFVNISSSHFNLDETLVSLTYASRVKQITNIASRNTESKEIARLKAVIAKLRRGEDDGELSS